MQVLKANFAGVTKALKPALKELAARSERKLKDAPMEEDRHYRRLRGELDRVWERKWESLRYQADTRMKAVQVQHGDMMETVADEYKVCSYDPPSLFFFLFLFLLLLLLLSLRPFLFAPPSHDQKITNSPKLLTLTPSAKSNASAPNTSPTQN